MTKDDIQQAAITFANQRHKFESAPRNVSNPGLYFGYVAGATQTAPKVTVEELLLIRSLANDVFRQERKPKDMEAAEFAALCWVKAISAKLQLNIQVELPTRWKILTPLK